MIALFVQTLLLMAVAYFVGASLACLVRRSLYRPAVAAPVSEARPVVPLPEIAARSAARFGGDVPRQAAPAAPVVAAPAPPQDLKHIQLIDAALEAGLNKLGVTRYEHIAAWMQPDVARIGKALGLKDRISRENWIEQAQVLAKGGETYYAKRRARGESPTAGPTPDEGARPSVRTSSPNVSERAAFAARRPEAPPAAASAVPPTAVPVRPAAPAARDNLQRIGGIDAGIEALLAAAGVTRYSQIAHWSPAEVTRFDQQVGGGGRVARENWIEQAQILSRGGDTAFSREFDRKAAPPLLPTKLGDAIRENASRTDLGALRSVRSQAYQNPEPGPAAAQRAAMRNKIVRSGAPDDLKRIRGIGVLIEKKLNSMGVTTYEQIANWTAEDIDRTSQSLDFKGRIERENWVEQARILASGGDTEFSRRVDRGEVETSRYRP